MAVALREYDAILIARPDLNEEGLTQLQGQFSDLVTRQGGRVVGSSSMGKRKLSFRIHRVHEGTYLQIRMELPPEGVAGLRKAAVLLDPNVRLMVTSAADLPLERRPRADSEEEENA